MRSPRRARRALLASLFVLVVGCSHPPVAPPVAEGRPIRVDAMRPPADEPASDIYIRGPFSEGPPPGRRPPRAAGVQIVPEIIEP